MIELLERQKRLTVNQWKLICTANLATCSQRARCADADGGGLALRR
jgi:hypothetical protein